MKKKHLIRLLTGNYGYIKAPFVEFSTMTEASDPSDSAAEAVSMEDPIDLVHPEGIPDASLYPFSAVSICVFIFPDC